MERQFENRNLKLENCDMPPKKIHFPENRISLPQCPQCQPLVSNRSSIGPSAQGPCLQGAQCHPRVSKHHPTDLKPVSPQHSSRSSARRPCPEVSQRHLRVADHPPTDLKTVSFRCHNRSSARRPSLQMPQWHPRGATVSWCIG